VLRVDDRSLLVAAFLRQLCDTVANVHQVKFVHHDISLTNIIVANNNQEVHLIDFGLAQHSATPEVLLESFGATPYFSSPELLCRKSHRGAPVDAYALGVILFCMVTNRLPYAANDIAELRRMAVQPAAVLFDDDNSPEVRALVLGLLQPDPARRLSLCDIISSEFMQKHAHDVPLSQGNAAGSSTSQTLPRSPSPAMLRHEELSMSAESTLINDNIMH